MVVAACWLAAGCGSGGGSSSTAPGTPVLAVVAGDSEATVSWGAVPGATSYILYWSSSPGVTPGLSAAVVGATSPWVHQGLTNGQAYYYAVVAANGAGASDLSSEAMAVPDSPYDPPWGSVAPRQTLTFEHDPGLSNTQNGQQLAQAIAALSPGQRLEIGSGTYSISARFDISLSGTAQAPIWIAAAAGETPIITRPNASQNTINIGSNGPSRYLALQGLEIVGGDTAVKIYDCRDLWIDRSHIHDCGGAGIAANSAHTDSIHLTRNEIHDTAGTAEGMYLGANNSLWVMSNSIVALNHIYDCAGTQGDGIELKQGSFGNWIVENLVHDTQYPCILVYGTDGNAINTVERNICYGSGDNVMQVQGEALVRNNLIMAGNVGFHSHDHQGTTRDLTVVHNTIINSGNATNLSSWNGRTNMVFANNVVYSESGGSIRFPSGSTGVTVSGNVVLGAVSGVGAGYVMGVGLSDFLDVTFDASSRNAVPAPNGAIVATGELAWMVAEDLTGAVRVLPLEAGAYDVP